MKPNFIEILKEHNPHSSFLDLKGCRNAMNEVYEIGKKDGEEQILNWLSKMDYLSDNINYIIEEYKNLKNE